jgi:protein transport protein SEC24
VFSTYDTSEKLKTKDAPAVLNENMDGMWYFVTFSYSGP